VEWMRSRLLGVSTFWIALWVVFLFRTSVDLTFGAAFPSGIALPAKKPELAIDAFPWIIAQETADAMGQPWQAPRTSS